VYSSDLVSAVSPNKEVVAIPEYCFIRRPVETRMLLTVSYGLNKPTFSTPVGSVTVLHPRYYQCPNLLFRHFFAVCLELAIDNSQSQ
jgi:hypothetical protein